MPIALNVRLILPLRTGKPRDAGEDDDEDDADDEGPTGGTVSAGISSK